MSVRLSLGREWTLGERIGSGGFGQVYGAHSPNFEPAVAKLVPKARGGQRELLFADLTDVRNVVPIIDSGETGDSWVLIMPRAEKSLRQLLDEAGQALPPASALAILCDIATALTDLDGKVVHRDLKPENILLLKGAWCVADFGISRYAEATTAPDTQKYALSAPYAAPERWRVERATIATDIYSLGVIAYELLTGDLPFDGPELEDFREQHLHGSQPNLPAVPASLRALVEECMYKAAAARPSPANVLARLGRIGRPAPLSGLAKLEEANLAEVARRSENVRRDSEGRTDADQRSALVGAAIQSLKRIGDKLREAIIHAAPAATLQSGRDGRWSIKLNLAELQFAPAAEVASNPWGSWKPPAFNAIAHAELSICVPPDRHAYEGRSHALWYCDARETDRYAWFETAFMVSPLIPRRGRQNPFALSPGENSAKALWIGMSEFQVAWPFAPLDIDDLNDFVNRWATWFADAAQGRLHQPSTMPERPADGSWRRL